MYYYVCSAGRITNVESLFWYETGAGYSDYQDLDWVPYFTTGSLPSGAGQVCGTNVQCLRDYFITNNTALAAVTFAAAGAASAIAKSLRKRM
jgi:hypothetical protein